MSASTVLKPIPEQAFVRISWSQDTLVLSQDTIHSLEAAADVEVDASIHNGCFGHIRKGQTLWPIYALEQGQFFNNTDFHYTHREAGIQRYGWQASSYPCTSEDYSLVVLLKNGVESYGLYCSDFKLLDPSQVRLYAVPACMASPDALLSALLLYDGEVYGIGNTAALLRHIREQMP